MAGAETAVALIAAGGVAVGATLTGGFALTSQLITRRSEERRALREAAERERTRFHEVRRETYAAFLGAVSDASGYFLNSTIKHQKEAGHDTGSYGLLRHSAEGDDTFSTVPKQMTRHQTIILMISGSQQVRQAAEELVTAVTIIGLQKPNADLAEWSRQVGAAFEEQRKAYRAFVDAVNAELAGTGSSNSVTVRSKRG